MAVAVTANLLNQTVKRANSMKVYLDGLKKEEQISLKLEYAFENAGYRKFKMRSFEEYSMYYSYSDFLASKNVITFSGLDGKLLALRPDVTLSIIKDTKASQTNTEKFFYNEKVYREFGKSKEYREISQIGVELIGAIDTYSYVEITDLALESLQNISNNYFLDVSDINVVEAVMDDLCQNSAVCKDGLYLLLKSKNTDDFLKLAESAKLSKSQIDAFLTLATFCSELSADMDFSAVSKLNENCAVAVENFVKVLQVLSTKKQAKYINVNFSIFGNADYYNGLIFNGYIQGVPNKVLSGGRYDKLLKKFGKDAGAIGFAVYLGEIERYLDSDAPVTDCLVLYADNADFALLSKEVETLRASGKSVRVDKNVPQNFMYSKLYKFESGKLIGVDND